jgi:hypothetical protein
MILSEFASDVSCPSKGSASQMQLRPIPSTAHQIGSSVRAFFLLEIKMTGSEKG